MTIKQFIKNLDVKVFVEIGAHFCTDTQDFRKMHPQARIVCFEPDPRNIEVIKKLGNDKICELHELALSNTNEPMDFHLSSGNPLGKSTDPLTLAYDWSFSSSLKKPTGHLDQHRWITFPNTVKVQCSKLDDFEPLKNTKIDFMWVDVQGAEDLVFSCAQETLKNTHYVYTEFSDYELYEGQLNLSKLLNLFGSEWELVQGVCPAPHPTHGGDILLRNTKMDL
jgi:FkbM family methyltransferase